MNQQALGMNNKRVLLISPLTFSYHLTICDALRSLGYEPVWWNDKASTSTAYKIALRLLPRLTRYLTRRHYLDRLEKEPQASFAEILIIKGEGLNAEVVDKLRERHPDASMGLYLWDSVENVKGVRGIAAYFDAISTFDPVDAKNNGWRYRPLFARDAALAVADNPEKDFDWCFIGTIHSDRHKVISRLRQRAGPKSKNFVFAYFQSPAVLRIRKLLDWTLWRAPSGTLSTTPMSASEVALVTARSRAVLDIEHPRQRGLTMRTIETLLVGRKLLSTNHHLLESDLYDASRACMIDRKAPAIDRTFLDSPANPVSTEVRERYTCTAWISELLGAQNQAREMKRQEIQS